jgi:Holliday junction resolvase RusA-like endonuclease
MTPTIYKLSVQGRAVPQGSKRAFVNKHTGRAMMLESSPRHKEWRTYLRHAAATHPHRPAEPLTGAVAVTLTITFKRPANHYHNRVAGRVLKTTATQWATSRSVGDIDKLQRAVYDSLTDAGWLADDSLIADVQAQKYWGDTDSVCVCVSEL